MKKFLSLTIAAAMLTGLLCACGGNNANQAGNENSNTEADTGIVLTEATGINLNNFTITDAKGDTVTEAVFGDYDITMVNCWTTWCKYCLEEMPYLNELYTELPDNVNLIGVCCDAYEEQEDFDSLVKQFEPEYIVIGGTEEFKAETGMDENLVGYPTTYFVDKNGNVVGQIVGTPGDNESLKDGYKKLINDALEKING